MVGQVTEHPSRPRSLRPAGRRSPSAGRRGQAIGPRAHARRFVCACRNSVGPPPVAPLSRALCCAAAPLAPRPPRWLRGRAVGSAAGPLFVRSRSPFRGVVTACSRVTGMQLCTHLRTTFRAFRAPKWSISVQRKREGLVRLMMGADCLAGIARTLQNTAVAVYVAGVNFRDIAELHRAALCAVSLPRNGHEVAPLPSARRR